MFPLVQETTSSSGTLNLLAISSCPIRSRWSEDLLPHSLTDLPLLAKETNRFQSERFVCGPSFVARLTKSLCVEIRIVGPKKFNKPVFKYIKDKFVIHSCKVI